MNKRIYEIQNECDLAIEKTKAFHTGNSECDKFRLNYFTKYYEDLKGFTGVPFSFAIGSFVPDEFAGNQILSYFKDNNISYTYTPGTGGCKVEVLR